MLRDDYWVEPTDLDRLIFERLVPADHYLRKVAAAIDFSFVRPALAECYTASTGRPGEDPTRLVKVLFLQYHYDLSDRKVFAEAHVNVAFRFFLGMSLESTLPHPTVLTYFRERVGPERFQRIFDAVVAQARAAGLVGDRLRLRDATHVIANIAVPSALRLVAQTREILLACLEALDEAGARAGREEANAIRERTADLKDEARLLARVEHLRALIAQAETVLAAPPSPKDEAKRTALSEALEQARKIVADRDPEASDRTLSLEDPDARRGRHGHFFDGYLVDVLVDADSQLITAVDVLPANADEAANAPRMVEQEEQAHGNDIEAVSLDSVNYRGDVLAQLVDAQDGPRMTVYVPPFDRHTPAEGRYGVEQFVLDADGVLRCPAGQTTTTFIEEPKRTGRRYRFTAAQCRGCPLREACVEATTKDRGRQVFKSQWAAQYARARQIATGVAYAAVRREHPGVERKISDLIRNHGGRRVRFRGRQRVRVQYVLAALAANIKRITNVLLPRREASLA